MRFADQGGLLTLIGLQLGGGESDVAVDQGGLLTLIGLQLGGGESDVAVDQGGLLTLIGLQLCGGACDVAVDLIRHSNSFSCSMSMPDNKICKLMKKILF